MGEADMSKLFLSGCEKPNEDGNSCDMGCIWACSSPEDHYTYRDMECWSVIAADHWGGNSGLTMTRDDNDGIDKLYRFNQFWVRLM
jgi:hypothetical protein